jgi:hypothetical protein
VIGDGLTKRCKETNDVKGIKVEVWIIFRSYVRSTLCVHLVVVEVFDQPEC